MKGHLAHIGDAYLAKALGGPSEALPFAKSIGCSEIFASRHLTFDESALLSYKPATAGVGLLSYDAVNSTVRVSAGSDGKDVDMC